MHTMLGHWNTAYHHGVWFQTTAFRPEMYAFEHEGGVLPVHELGLRLSGRHPLASGRLEYSATVSNGRSPVATEFANLRDFDRNKAVNLWLALAPGAPSGLKVGAMMRFDRIPAIAGDPSRDVPLSEEIVGGFATYQRAKLELLGEAILVRHREQGGPERSFRTSGFYVQASRRWGRFTPYYRFEGLDRAPDDPYYANSDDLRRHVAGLRADPWAWAALKLEMSHDAVDPGPSVTGATLQAAFTF
jgi:hypothetical protein